ncbi:MAG: hypothetical protein GY721_05655 [Deltaproteobacteria bacterium]|nr:hypothetical protein [Deltaproteobacteria bacterium]
MSIGSSGRIVIEIDPGMKRQLYAALVQHQATMKEWFVKHAQHFIENQSQLTLDIMDNQTQHISTGE